MHTAMSGALLRSFARPFALAFSIAIAITGLLATPVAHAGLFDDEEARKAILELRQRLDQANEQNRARLVEQLTQLSAQLNSQLNAQVAQQNTQLTLLSEQLTQMKRSMVDLNNLIEQLRADNAKLRGQDELLARDLAETQRKQKDIVQSVDERVRKFEPIKVTVDNREFLAEPDEKRLYEEAMAVFRKGDFEKAANVLASFRRRFPVSGFYESVLFWLGNAQYGKRDYATAINTFRELVTVSPEHPRAAESLLSIANCQLELKDPNSARTTLAELAKAYPNSEAAQAGKDRLASIR
ncbi:MAG: tol-pal system protein YbgF [Burkholderiaceae bacterium]